MPTHLPDDQPAADFAEVLAANQRYATSHRPGPRADGRADRGLAVVTCMDSRLDPLSMLGLRPGDAKILRNAGARVTDDVLRTLVLAVHLLGVHRVMLIAHTRCRMAGGTEEDVHEAILAAGGPDTHSLAFLTTENQDATLLSDARRIRSWPYLPGVTVGGFVYDVDTGLLRQVC